MLRCLDGRFGQIVFYDHMVNVFLSHNFPRYSFQDIPDYGACLRWVRGWKHVIPFTRRRPSDKCQQTRRSTNQVAIQKRLSNHFDPTFSPWCRIDFDPTSRTQNSLRIIALRGISCSACANSLQFTHVKQLQLKHRIPNSRSFSVWCCHPALCV